MRRWRLAGLVPPGFRADLAAAGWAVVAGTVRRAVQQRHRVTSLPMARRGRHSPEALPGGRAGGVAWRAPPVGGEHPRHPEGPSLGWSAMASTPAVAVGAGRPAAGGPGRRRLVQLAARRRRQGQPGLLRPPTHPPNPHQAPKPRAPSMPPAARRCGRGPPPCGRRGPPSMSRSPHSATTCWDDSQSSRRPGSPDGQPATRAATGP